MDDKFGFGFMTCVIFVLLYLMGWVIAHAVIASECEKLGSFYVGKSVYECKLKDGK